MECSAGPGEKEKNGDAACHRALHVFKEVEGSAMVLKHITKKRAMFNLALKFVRDNVSFVQAAKHVHSVREETELTEYTRSY